MIACEIEVKDIPLCDVPGGKDRTILHHFELGQVRLHCRRTDYGPARGVGFFFCPPFIKSLIEAFDFFLQGEGLLFDFPFDFPGLLGLSFRFQKQVGFIHVVEQAHQPVILVMGDGIVLMGVALSAACGQPHPNRTRGGDPVHRGIETEFQGIDPALFVQLGVTVKPGGSFLFVGGIGQHVPGQLFDAELIIGHIRVEGSNDPVPVGPDIARSVLLIPIGVGIAGEVEPFASPLFPVARGGKQLVDQPFVGVRSLVADEGIRLFGGGGQTDQVEIEATHQTVAIGLGRRLEIMLCEVFENEGIDFVTLPLRIFCGRIGGNGRNEGPVFLVFRSFLNPLVEQVLFILCERGVGLGRGHDLIGVIGADAVMKFALFYLARNDDLAFQGILADIESQFCLPSLFVWTMASIALAGQQGTDFPIEINALQWEGRQNQEVFGKGRTIHKDNMFNE